MDQVDNSAKLGTPRRWGRIIGFSLLALIVLLIAGHAFWGWWQEKKLAQEVAALRAKGEPMLAEELVNSPVPDAENAVILLKEAGASIDEKDETWREFDRLELGVPLNEKEIGLVRPLVESHREALRKLRQARGRKGVDWKLDPSRTILLPQVPLKSQHVVANLAWADLLLEHQKGNDREAVELVKDLLAQSDAVEQMPGGLVAHLLGIGMVGSACNALEEIGPELKIGTGEGEVAPAEVRKLIEQLLNEKSLSDGQRLALRVERAWEVQAAPLQGVAEVNAKPSAPLAFMAYVMRPLFIRDGRIMLRHVTEMIEATETSKDWPEYERRAKSLSGRIGQSRSHMMIRILAPGMDAAVERNFRCMTDRRLAAVALAMRLHAVEHEGKLPAKLEELVPNYLPAVPDDPMGSGRKIGYVAEEARPRIYSVGTNVSDEEGSEEAMKRGTKAWRWAREDVVVHLKRQPREHAEEDGKE